MSYEELKTEANQLALKVIAVNDRMTAMKRQAQRDLPLPNYKWVPTVVITESISRFYDIPAGTQVLMFDGQLSNSKVYEDYLNTYGSINNRPEANRTSHRYWRKNKVLIPQGGGCSVLIPYVIVNDEEWEQMKAGNIPDRFMHKKNDD